MKIFKPTFKGKDGKTKICQCWYIGFTDNRGVRRRLPAYTILKASEKLAEVIKELIVCNGNLTAELQKQVEQLPQKVQQNLIKFGIIDGRQVKNNLGKTLGEHLDDFAAALLAKGASKSYVKYLLARIKHLFDVCAFKMYGDIDANKIYTTLASWRGDSGIGQRTFNYYLKATKQFCRWMIRERRASINPIEHLTTITQTEKRRQRRALTLDEQRRLIQAAENGTMHHNLTGYERALVYKLALQTGLRANEIRNLIKVDFDFTARKITVKNAYTKNRKLAIICLTPTLAADLKNYLADKLPNVKAFEIPVQPSKMIQIDLAAANIPYKTDEGQADFHSLRHDFITNLAVSGVQPYEAMELARHSTITLTMNHYTHTKLESLRKIIDAQPDLTSKEKQDIKDVG